jgi:hypothetical protein
MVLYANPVNAGTNAVNSLGDGYSINISWYLATPNVSTNKIAYHIYYSTNKDGVFLEGPKFVSIDASLQANIINLTPGQEYYFAIRPVEYNPNIFNLSLLPISHDNLRFYPYSILRNNIGYFDTSIPLIDVSEFPNTGIVRAGIELIQYLAVDRVNNNLIVAADGYGSPVSLVDQGGGHYYTAYGTNVGSGIFNSLTAVSGAVAPSETWTVKCIFVKKDGYGNSIHNTAQFIAEGSISGCKLDGYGNQYVWKLDGYAVSNGVFSFSITENSPYFKLGDSFTIKVAGATAGTQGGRGYANTFRSGHTVGGFDGYSTWDSSIPLFTIGEDMRWDRIFVCQCRFEYPNYQYTAIDGYHQTTKDILSTDLTAADAANVVFPMYDFAGYHRTDPVQLLNGTCVGSYIGGEQGCIDGDGNVNMVRGLSLQDQSTQRQDVLLSVTGRNAVLIRRVQTGITCYCYQPSSEYQDDRCPSCYGTKFVIGYEQYYNPRSSDGRIKVRASATPENLKMRDAGLESEFPLDLWTLTVPTIKTRDIIVLFDQDDNEEFRYEVSDVTRNNTVLGLNGGQHFKVFRVRKFDPAYQIRIFRNTAMFPSKLATTVGLLAGVPHTHTILTNEKITSLTQINQMTSVSNGHAHEIISGIVQPILGHSHVIILP